MSEMRQENQIALLPAGMLQYGQEPGERTPVHLLDEMDEPPRRLNSLLPDKNLPSKSERCDNMENNGQARTGVAPEGKKKSRIFKILGRIVIVLLMLAIGTGTAVFFYARYTKTHYTITFYQKASKKVSQNIRLAVISDIHNQEYGEGNATLISDIQALKPDLCITAAFGQILSREVLDVPSLGNINVHASLLPRHRGAAPIAHAIMDGDEKAAHDATLAHIGSLKEIVLEEGLGS